MSILRKFRIFWILLFILMVLAAAALAIFILEKRESSKIKDKYLSLEKPIEYEVLSSLGGKISGFRNKNYTIIPPLVERLFLSGDKELGSYYPALAKTIIGRKSNRSIAHKVADNILPISEENRDFRKEILAHKLNDKFKKDELENNFLNTLKFSPFILGFDEAADKYLGKEIQQLNNQDVLTLYSIYKSYNNNTDLTYERTKAVKGLVTDKVVSKDEAENINNSDVYYFGKAKFDYYNNKYLPEIIYEARVKDMKSGDIIYSTLDEKLQSIIVNALETRKASIIVKSAKDGSILAKHIKSDKIEYDETALSPLYLLGAFEMGFHPNDKVGQKRLHEHRINSNEFASVLRSELKGNISEEFLPQKDGLEELLEKYSILASSGKAFEDLYVNFIYDDNQKITYKREPKEVKGNALASDKSVFQTYTLMNRDQNFIYYKSDNLVIGFNPEVIVAVHHEKGNAETIFKDFTSNAAKYIPTRPISQPEGIKLVKNKNGKMIALKSWQELDGSSVNVTKDTEKQTPVDEFANFDTSNLPVKEVKAVKLVEDNIDPIEEFANFEPVKIEEVEEVEIKDIKEVETVVEVEEKEEPTNEVKVTVTDSPKKRAIRREVELVAKPPVMAVKKEIPVKSYDSSVVHPILIGTGGIY